MVTAQQQKPVWSDELLAAPHDVSDKARRVRSMFNAIARRYELVNSVCSGGRDAHWRRKAVAMTTPGANDTVLDVACGTGDLARAFLQAGVESVLGCDFAHEMLVRAVEGEPNRHLPVTTDEDLLAARASACVVKGSRPFAAKAGSAPAPGLAPPRSNWVEADALRLPFADDSFTIVSCAFGVRNFADLDAGLREFRRVLRKGGRAVILEFTRPRRDWFRRLYEIYANRIMPCAATMISGDTSGAYRYLPRSVVSFISAEEMCQRLRQAGFAGIVARPLTFGVVTVYLAQP